MADPSPSPVAEHSEPNIYTSLTYHPLSPTTHLAHVRTSEAGALVLFAGTTRDTFDNRPVANLTYQAYVPLALNTLTSIAREILSQEFGGGDKNGGKKIKAIAISHRLGVVPIGEESILIAVSAAHRTEAWRAGEQCLEEVKKRTEIWKLETFADGGEGCGGDGEGEGGGEAVWRANKDTTQVGKGKENEKQQQEEKVPETMGPVIRPRRLGEKGHGAVVHPGGRKDPEEQSS